MRLLKRSVPLADGCRFLNQSIIKTFTDTLQNLSSTRALMTESILGLLLQQLQVLPEEVLKIKRLKRSWDSVLQKYESVLSKHASLSRTKEASALREVIHTNIRMLLYCLNPEKHT